MKANHILASQSALGEGPLWSTKEQALYWVDIEGKTINRYRPSNAQHESFPVDAKVGVIAFRKGGDFIAAGSTGFVFWTIGSPKLDLIFDPEENNAQSRFNDGKVDRAGRFWAGTMTPEGAVSALYRVNAGLNIQKMESGITISNGIGWSPDNQIMYYADSSRYVIYAYDFDLNIGSIKNRRDWIKFSPEYGIPDGLTVDSEGYVWCAFYSGAKVTRFNPQGKMDIEISLPVSQPTSCAFGGKDLTDLYITSSWLGLTEEERAAQPLAGDIFMVKTDVPGLPEPEFEG
ncbi:MAG: SMP-30/gluconolactonase/LRE family protein [Anaerolineaceae bacterium]|jgi:sugar lactone lactonase YvrE|nr:SMP-30/gluconolactonase/LRE family protein [Anaerolineaceae bacterium]